MGRTKGSKNGMHGANIDQKQFEGFCAILCTEEEICAFFSCSHDTLNRWCHDTYECTFEQIFKQKATLGKISIRRYQFKQAASNPTMAIWLGKQILGQTEKVEADVIDKIEVVSDVKDN